MLEISGLTACYGPVQVLHGLSLSVGAGEIHALLGRNGAGKTTTLRRIMGLLPPQDGRIHVGEDEITLWPTPRIARSAIAYVSEGRDIFASLSVRENLLIAGRIGRGAWTLDRIAGLFPVLGARLNQPAGTLSGGEQQMLAIGRALMTSPRLLILDEPTEGLALPVQTQLADMLAGLKADGLTTILVEQNLRFATALADRITLVSGGRDVWNGDPAAFAHADDIRRRFLGA
ncbi:ABC transporter ATP-binding protein [Paracoccus aerodenitrificans]|uniref:ABC transporter ATP-binding protein n=1 Tax=Paracoccus aerodenitrificans TaxID=3017781 RepID=UPI0022F012B9|nr:ABC transporter ATP-binding protein [Paracoccus aerodenitrificans]WBU64056.1 ABC transporter ATP-binding protein [Paracoccus aerodenitrificans]